MRLLLLCAILLCGQTVPASAQSHFVIVSGLGGDNAHRDQFYNWATSLVSTLRETMGVAPENIIYLAERPERDQTLINAKSTKENVTEALSELASRSAADAVIFVFLIGHGSYQGESSRLSLPGPDMSAEDFARLLGGFETQKIVFVNTASASGDFVEALSAPGRTIVTATKSPFERNETIFCEFFIEALAEDVADVDKDERVSVLEAFSYASAEVARYFDSQSRLLTEHAVLDDNGDGVGSSEPDPKGGDGALARVVFLDAGAPTRSLLAADDPELKALYDRRAQLEGQVLLLRNRKEGMEAAVYENELEKVLIELAQLGQTIRERESLLRRP